MTPCVCGKRVRLGAMRVSVNRQRGVFHHIVHMADDTKPCIPGDWSCCMLKPYPKNDADKGWHKMLARWEAAVISSQCTVE